MNTSPTGDQSPVKALRSPKKTDRAFETFTNTVSAVKTTIKVIKAFSTSNDIRLKPFAPPGKRQQTIRIPLVTEDRLYDPINFQDPEDRKLIIDILTLKPQTRVEEEVALTRKAFTDMDFFKKVRSDMDETHFNKIFQVMKVEFFKAGQRVFSHGDIGKNFYIVIQGSVYIMLKSTGVVVTEEQALMPQNCQNEDVKRLRENLNATLQSDISEEEKRDFVEECYPGFWIVSKKKKGDSFGEIALNKTGNRLRTATVVCSEDTIFGILAYNDYQTILGALHEKKFAENLECMSQVDIFHHWKENQLTSFLMSIEEVKFTRNQAIFKAGDVPDQLYFIKRGEVELRKVVDYDKDKEESPDEKHTNMMSRPTSSRPKQWRRQEAVRLAILTKCDYFGEEEIIKVKPREYTAVAYSTEVVLLTMTKEKFLSFVKDKKSMQTLDSHIRGKKDWHSNLLTKVVTLRTLPPEPNIEAAMSPTAKPKEYFIGQSLTSIADDAFESPRIVKTSSSPLRLRPVSILLDDKNNVQTPLLNSARTKTMQAIPLPSPKLSPKLKKQPSDSPKNPQKERPVQIMSPEFSFTSFKKATEGRNPIYEKHMEKMSKKQRQSRLQTERTPSDVRTVTISKDGQSSISIKTKKVSLTPHKTEKIQDVIKSSYGKWSDYGEGCSPIAISTPRYHARGSQISTTTMTISDSPMYKMCRTLGLDRIYSEQEAPMVGLNGFPCVTVKSLLKSSRPNYNSSNSNSGTPKERSVRKYSCQMTMHTMPDSPMYSSPTTKVSNYVSSPKAIYFSMKK